MTEPRQAQLPLLLSISEGLSRGTDEMLRVSPQGDAIHPASCSLAIREAVEEIKWLRAEVERLRGDAQAISAIAHTGGTAKLSEHEALVEIRRRTLKAWGGRTSRKALEAKP